VITKAKFWAAAVAAIILLMAFDGFRNYNGYCSSQNRFLSDAEKIHIAATIINNNGEVAVKVGRDVRYYKSVRYKDADDLIRQNPNCCRVTFNERSGDTPPPPSFLGRLAGLYGADVMIDGTAHYIDEQGKEQSLKRQWLVLMDHCGHTMKY
jgi:hypothetical protein